MSALGGHSYRDVYVEEDEGIVQPPRFLCVCCSVGRAAVYGTVSSRERYMAPRGWWMTTHSRPWMTSTWIRDSTRNGRIRRKLWNERVEHGESWSGGWIFLLYSVLIHVKWMNDRPTDKSQCLLRCRNETKRHNQLQQCLCIF